jgi:hypothetical protein
MKKLRPVWTQGTLALGAESYSSSLLLKNIESRKYRTIILPFVLYGFENWSLTLMGEHRLTAFENSVLRKIFGPKRDGGTGEWRRIQRAL